MKKQILALCASAAMLTSVCSFGSCSKAAENTRMTVDINPSVELMVDKDNKVISVTALNDDAAVILQGEASIVGKESDDAVKAIVSLATDTGYIVKGEVSADENTVKISVSGDTKWAKDLAKDAEKKVNQFFKDSGIAGTANEFIYPQMIKYLVPEGAMGEGGIYGAIVKIGMVLMLFVQMYRLAAEPFFLADYKKSDFLQMNAAALKYYVLVSMFIFLGIAFFRDLFGLIVGKDFREGIGILPVVLGANVLNGVWLNLSFWYKREERTSLAIVVTFVGLIFTIGCSLSFIPRWGYYGAAWARLVSEAAMVAVSFWLNRRFYPMPYQTGRILGYVALALVLYGVSVVVDDQVAPAVPRYACYAALLLLYFYYAVRREKIDLRALVRSAMHRGHK